eukprot:scaffold70683_cov60-Cyclotella_meneghiniana.AAC.1
MLLCSTANHPYVFQMMLGQMLDMEGIKRETCDLLSRNYRRSRCFQDWHGHTQIIDTVLSKEQLVSASILDNAGNLLFSTEASTTLEQLHNEEGAAVRLKAGRSNDKTMTMKCLPSTECVAKCSMLTAI